MKASIPGDYAIEGSVWIKPNSPNQPSPTVKQWINYRPSTRLKSNRIGRNDPCICGSLKKFKKCCANSKV